MPVDRNECKQQGFAIIRDSAVLPQSEQNEYYARAPEFARLFCMPLHSEKENKKFYCT